MCMKLSVCMIVKNEADVLGRVLNDVINFADEIIIVDTGSTDNTKEIAYRYTSKVYDFEWCDDFSKARNFSFSLATMDYIMWLDADDTIPLSEQIKINLLREKDASELPDCIMCYYVQSVDANNQPKFMYYRERIVRNHFGFEWLEPVHEVIVPMGNIEYSDIKIYHKKVKPTLPKRNLKIYQKLEKSKTPLSPRAMYYYSRELYYNNYPKKAIKMIHKFLKSDGWAENKIDACLIRAKCYILENKYEDAKISLTQSFAYAPPRANICCELGRLYFNEKAFRTAKFWYKLALQCEKNKSGWIEPDYFGYIPAIQLCVCCFALGEKESARHYHNLSKIYKPNSPQVLFNEKFFT